MVDFVKAIADRMTEEDCRFYAGIYAPTEVATPDTDAWSSLCVTKDGEIRAYGRYGIKSVFDSNAQRVYIASADGGLSWKRHFVDDPEVLGASTYVPYLDRYIALRGVPGEGMYLCAAPSPDDPISEKHLILGVCTECRAPFVMRSRNRVLVVVHERRPELHPTSYFPVVYYADGDLSEWHAVPQPAVPFYKPEDGHKGIRWQQNSRENTIEELSDGRLVMFSRTATDFHYVTFSSDGGETWSKPEPSVFHATSTMPLVKRLSDGAMIFVWCNTRLLREREDADGIWEDVFTNRDVNHIALSEDDGATWKGFREMALNPLRYAPDFRTVGGPEEGRDKSVHQFEAMELPYGKLLVFYGQNLVRRLVILDRKWILGKERCDDFIHGLSGISTFGYMDSVIGCYRGTPEAPLSYAGHCAYNRVCLSYLMPDDTDDGREALQICRPGDPRLVSTLGGAVWNFPTAEKGSVNVRLRVVASGVRLSLLDYWANPCDDEIADLANFTTEIRGDMLKAPDAYSDVTLRFDCGAKTAELSVDGKFRSRTKLKGNFPNGLCYLHIQTLATDTDYVGTYVKKLDFRAE